MASPASALSRSALHAHDALVLEHLPLADAVASATARRLFPLVEREDLIQVAREALVRSAPRCRSCEPAAPYLRPCISGALQHHLRDWVQLVWVPRHDEVQARRSRAWGHSCHPAARGARKAIPDVQLQPLPISWVAASDALLGAAAFKARQPLSVADAWIAAVGQQEVVVLIHKDPGLKPLVQLAQEWLGCPYTPIVLRQHRRAAF